MVKGSPETAVRNVRFSNVQIETSGEHAILCRHCEGVKLNNVELSNRPADKDGRLGNRPGNGEQGRRS